MAGGYHHLSGLFAYFDYICQTSPILPVISSFYLFFFWLESLQQRDSFHIFCIVHRTQYYIILVIEQLNRYNGIIIPALYYPSFNLNSLASIKHFIVWHKQNCYINITVTEPLLLSQTKLSQILSSCCMEHIAYA